MRSKQDITVLPGCGVSGFGDRHVDRLSTDTSQGYRRIRRRAYRRIRRRAIDGHVARLSTDASQGRRQNRPACSIYMFFIHKRKR
ncbi:MAG: hypothetical protein LBL33_02315 [Tannerella sp.]|nr:hypothetical protein [Tannerella sp.]